MATKRSNEEFLIQVKADIDQATAELRKFTREIDSTGKAGKRAAPGITHGAAGIRSMVAAAGAYIGLSMVTQILREADAWNTLQARIRTATRGTGDYVQVSEQLFAISQRNGQQLNTSVALFQNLARTAPELAATNQDMLRLTNTVQQLGVISGTTYEAQRNGLIQFTQGLAGVVFRAEEFNSIIENLPELAKRIAQGMGLTVGQLRAAVIEGKVLSRDVYQAIQSQAADISRQFDELPDNMQRATTALGNSLDRFFAALDKTTGTTNAVNSLLRLMSRSLDNLSTRLDESDLAEAQRERAEAMQRYIELQDRSDRRSRAQAVREKANIDLLDERIKKLSQAQLAAEKTTATPEQGGPAPGSVITAEEQKALDEYQRSVQKLSDRLDPAGAATRQLAEDLELLNRQFFVDESISFERYDELVNALLGTRDAARDASEELDAMDRALDLIEQQFADLDEAEARQIAGLEKFTDAGKDSFDELNAAIRGWGDNFTNTLVDMVTTGELSFKRLADSIIRDLLRIAIQMNITQPLFNAIMPGTFPAPTNHAGGIAGTGSPKRVSPWVFANAPRYHSGGIAGLASNEVPAILQRGEEVLTRDDPRHIANQRSGPVKVVIENKGQPIEAESAEARIDPDGLVISVFTRDLREGGPMSRSLQGTFGLNRK